MTQPVLLHITSHTRTVYQNGADTVVIVAERWIPSKDIEDMRATKDGRFAITMRREWSRRHGTDYGFLASDFDLPEAIWEYVRRQLLHRAGGGK